MAPIFPLGIAHQIGLDTGPELFSGQAALVGVVLGVAVFLVFLLANALMYAGTRKKVVIPYLPRIVGERGLLVLLVIIFVALVGVVYLMLTLWPPSQAG